MNNPVLETDHSKQINKSAQYECEVCEISFGLLDHMVVCPCGGSKDLRNGYPLQGK